MRQRLITTLPALGGVVVASLLSFTIPGDAFGAGRQIAALGRVEETLMYEVSRDAPTRLAVPIGTEEVLLDVVAPTMVDPGPQARFALRIEATLLSTATRYDWSIFVESRKSFGRDAEGHVLRGTYVAGSAGATDVRTLRLPVKKLVSQYPGVLELRAGELSVAPLLVRGFARRSPELSARNLLDAPTLDKSLLTGRLNVGSGMLRRNVPSELHRASLSLQPERLSALGQRDLDYRLRRVKMTSFRTRNRIVVEGAPPARDPRPRVLIDRDHWTALTLRGAANLRVFGPFEGLQARLVQRARGDRGLVSKPHHYGLITIDGTDEVRTLVIAPRSKSDRCTTAPCVIAIEEAGPAPVSWIGHVDRSCLGHSCRVGPDVRRSRFWRLDGLTPTTFAVARGQERLYLQFRTQLDDARDLVARVKALVLVHAGDDVTHRYFIDETPDLSPFERWMSNDPASQTVVHSIDLPPNTATVDVFGGLATRVRALVEEPDVHEDRWAPPYDVAPTGLRFVFASKEQSRFTVVRPEPVASGDDDRTDWLYSQVRLVRTSQGSQTSWQALTARTLEAVGNPPEHRLWIEDREPLGREGIWTDITKPQTVQVSAENTEVALLVEMPSSALGRSFSLKVDGNEYLHDIIRLSSQEHRINLSEGVHAIEVAGLDTGGRAFIRAEPVYGVRLRQRRFERLSSNEKLSYYFHAEPGEQQRVLLEVVSATTTWSLDTHVQIRVSGGDRVIIDSQRTRMPGVHVPATYVDRKEEDRMHLSRVWVRLPKSILSTERTVDVAFSQNGSGWVRAVLQSDRPPPTEQRVRLLRSRVVTQGEGEAR